MRNSRPTYFYYYPDTRTLYSEGGQKVLCDVSLGVAALHYGLNEFNCWVRVRATPDPFASIQKRQDSGRPWGESVREAFGPDFDR